MGAHAAARGNSVNFRVLTFNVWGLTPPLARDLAPRMRAIGDALPKLALDVAALQEVWDADARARLVAAGQAAGLSHSWHRESALRGSGLLVLSRHPIRRWHFEAFELEGWPEAITHADYWGGKGIAELTLETEAGDICLLDTHLHAAYAERERDPYVGHRIGQVLQLVERIGASSLPLIAAGDFNFEARFAEYAILTRLTGLADTARTLGQLQDTVLRSNPYRADGGEPDERIDYIFSRAGDQASLLPRSIARVFTEPVEIDARSAAFSDHAGLVAEFELRSQQAPPLAPDAELLDRTAQHLASARDDAVARRDRQRLLGAAALAAAGGAWWAGRRPAQTRRSFLQRLLTGAGAGAGLLGAGALIRSEAFRAREIAGFDAALRRVERLRRSFKPVADVDPAAARAPSRQ